MRNKNKTLGQNKTNIRQLLTQQEYYTIILISIA